MTVTLLQQQYESPDGIQSPRRATRVLRGLAAEIPVLTEGEFYYATDTKAVSIGPTPTALATASAVTSAVATETARAEAAEALLAPLASPALTGTPTAPTQSPLTNNTDIATTAYTDLAVGVETTRAEAAEALRAPIASPTFTGVVTAPTLVESTTLSPTSAGTAGTTGQIAWDATKVYVCTSGGIAGSATWKAATLTAV